MSKGKCKLVEFFPWLETFDKNVVDVLAVASTLGEVQMTDLIWLLTDLESNVSSEVSKLKSRPNRATRFMTVVKKKLSMIKVAALTIDSREMDADKKLYPTYGLLMMNLVNINLFSSKMERLGAEKLAVELYYQLKLVFEGDSSYILDVVLCSTLDEHCSSNNTVGYRLFSLLIGDWRLFASSYENILKYLTLCKILIDSCDDGRQHVSSLAHLNYSISVEFRDFLIRKMGGSDFAVHKLKYFKDVCRFVKTAQIKKSSRERLVVVSSRITYGREAEASETSDQSPEEENPEENGQEMPSSSVSVAEQMDDLLGQLGLGGGFYLSTTGDSSSHALGEEMYDDDQVTSSNPKYEEETEEMKEEENEEIKEEENDSEEVEVCSPRRLDRSLRNNRIQDESEEDEEENEENEVKVEEDSDLEVISEVITSPTVNDFESDNGGSEASRDEAEPESGEDEVPNYNEDSDEEKSPPFEALSFETGGGEEEKQSETQEKVEENEESDSKMEESEETKTSDQNNDQFDADDDKDSDVTHKLGTSPAKPGASADTTSEADKSQAIPEPTGSEVSLLSIPAPSDQPSPRGRSASPRKSQNEETPSKRRKLDASSPPQPSETTPPLKSPLRSPQTATRGRRTRASLAVTLERLQPEEPATPTRRTTRSRVASQSQSTPVKSEASSEPSSSQPVILEEDQESQSSTSSTRGRSTARRGRGAGGGAPSAPVRSSQRLKHRTEN